MTSDVRKTVSDAAMVQAYAPVHQDEAHVPLPEPLTKRELDVLALLAAGMSNKEIACGLQLTVNTVKTHILNIYGKLRVNRRMHAVNKACALQLLKRG